GVRSMNEQAQANSQNLGVKSVHQGLNRRSFAAQTAPHQRCFFRCHVCPPASRFHSKIPKRRREGFRRPCRNKEDRTPKTNGEVLSPLFRQAPTNSVAATFPSGRFFGENVLDLGGKNAQAIPRTRGKCRSHLP